MTTYVALLRGIGPSNPNMHQAKLCGVLEELGLKNVRGVISSGNVLFESDSSDVGALEERIETAWPAQLGFQSTTIVRSKQQLEELVARDPYKGVAEDPKLYRLVTFFQQPTTIPFRAPHTPEGKPYTIVAVAKHSVCSVIDLHNARTPDFMIWTERQFGKQITSRTWATVNRILKKME